MRPSPVCDVLANLNSEGLTMNVGVIGASGFIGSHVVDKLIDAGHDVTAFDIMTPHRNDVRHINIDVLDLTRTVVALAGRYDAVYHLAAMANVNDVYRNPVEAGHVNVMAVANVLEAARRNEVGRVVLASTVWIYDLAAGDDVDEDTQLMPRKVSHVYTATKLAAESYCWAYQNLYETPVTILRYGIPYGPRARGGTVMAAFVQRALKGEPLTINGSGKNTRNYVYVEDLAEGNVAALQEIARNRIYNLEGKRPVTILEVAQAVKKLVRDVPIEHREAREGDFGGRTISAERAARELKWEPKVDIEEGIERYVAWYRTQENKGL